MAFLDGMNRFLLLTRFRMIRKGWLLPVLCLILLAGCQGRPVVPGVAVRQDDTVAVEEERDYGCSYFYFLWGRQAELAGRLEESLEAYEKALLCDPSSRYIIRKIPILLLRMDRGKESVARLKEYLRHHPDDADFRMLLAKVLIRQGNLEEAAHQYQLAHDQDPENYTSLLLLSELYLAQGKKELAGKTLERVIELADTSYPAHVLLARLNRSMDRYDRAMEEYRKALELNWSVDLEMEMADTCMEEKEYDRAAEIYREILKRSPGNEDVRLALVHVYLLQEKDTLALEELDRLKMVSDHPERVDLAIAKLYARREQYDKAIAILQEIADRESSSEVRYLLAILYFQDEQYDRALHQLQLIGPESGDYEDAVFLQVRIYRDLEQPEKAIELLEKAIADEKGRSVDMYVLLAALYQATKRNDLGRKTFARGLEIYPNDDNLLYEYGLFLDHSNAREEAIQVMEKVIRIQPHHAAALNYVGYTWADRKIHLDKALEYIQRAVALKPDNGYILDSLGWVYFRLGRLEEARKTLEKSLTLAPDDPAILDHLGDVYLELGRSREALEAYRKAVELFKEEKDRQPVREKIRILLEQETQ